MTGKGEWENKRIVEGERVEFELRFVAFTANGHFAVSDGAVPGQCRVEWVYHSGMNWPVNLVLLFMDMDKIIGKDIAESLAKLKANLETGAVAVNPVPEPY